MSPGGECAGAAAEEQTKSGEAVARPFPREFEGIFQFIILEKCKFVFKKWKNNFNFLFHIFYLFQFEGARTVFG